MRDVDAVLNCCLSCTQTPAPPVFAENHCAPHAATIFVRMRLPIGPQCPGSIGLEHLPELSRRVRAARGVGNGSQNSRQKHDGSSCGLYSQLSAKRVAARVVTDQRMTGLQIRLTFKHFKKICEHILEALSFCLPIHNISRRTWACPSMSYDHGTVCAWNFSHLGVFPGAAAATDIRDPDILARRTFQKIYQQKSMIHQQNHTHEWLTHKTNTLLLPKWFTNKKTHVTFHHGSSWNRACDLPWWFHATKKHNPFFWNHKICQNGTHCVNKIKWIYTNPKVCFVTLLHLMVFIIYDFVRLASIHVECIPNIKSQEVMLILQDRQMSSISPNKNLESAFFQPF